MEKTINKESLNQVEAHELLNFSNQNGNLKVKNIIDILLS